MGDLDQPRAPKPPAAVGGLQQLFEILTNEELIATGHGLVSQKAFEPIEQVLWVQRQTIHQVAVAAVAEQHLKQMLHIQLAMAPTPGQVLACK